MLIAVDVRHGSEPEFSLWQHGVMDNGDVVLAPDLVTTGCLQSDGHEHSTMDVDTPVVVTSGAEVPRDQRSSEESGTSRTTMDDGLSTEVLSPTSGNEVQLPSASESGQKSPCSSSETVTDQSVETHESNQNMVCSEADHVAMSDQPTTSLPSTAGSEAMIDASVNTASGTTDPSLAGNDRHSISESSLPADSFQPSAAYEPQMVTALYSSLRLLLCLIVAFYEVTSSHLKNLGKS